MYKISVYQCLFKLHIYLKPLSRLYSCGGHFFSPSKEDRAQNSPGEAVKGLNHPTPCTGY